MTALPKIALNTNLDKGMCFGCGKKNPIGLKMEFSRDGDGLQAVFTPDKIHQGWPGVVHGGILACVLDEAMSNVAYADGTACLTASMHMRLRQPAMVAVPLVVTARVTKQNRKLIETEARICLEDGTVVAEGTAKQFIAEDEAEHSRRVKEQRSHV